MFDCRLLCFCVALSACGNKPARPTLATEPPKVLERAATQISSIQILGGDDALAQQLRPLLLAKVDAEWTPELIAADINALWKSGLIDDVRALRSLADDGGVELSYQVKPVPTVRNWRLSGAEAVEAETISQFSGVGAALDRDALGLLVTRVGDALRDRGHFRAEAEISLLPAGKDEVDVVLQLNPGPIAKRLKLKLVGNRKIPSARLRKLLNWRDSLYREDEVAAALLKITAAYYDAGFIDCKVHAPTLEYSETKEGVVVTVRIDENAIYRLGTISVKSELIGAAASFEGELQARRGQIFNRSKIGEDIQRLRTLLSTKGHPNAKIAPISKVHATQKIIDLTYQITDS